MPVQLSRKIALLCLVVMLLIAAFKVPASLDVKITPELEVTPSIRTTVPAVRVTVKPAVTLKTPTVTVMVAPAVKITPAVTTTLKPAIELTPLVTVEPIADALEARLSLIVKSTAYNSLEAQTDSTPNITAIGSQTRFGIIAVSRDLLNTDLPYGSLVRLKDMGNYHNGREVNKYQAMLDSQGLFIVEDTMHARKMNQIDVWFPRKSEALEWGVRQVEVELVRYGWDGPEIMANSESDTDISMQ